MILSVSSISRGDEAQGDGHHHGQLMDRHMDLFQRAQQGLQPVGEQDGEVV